MKRLDEIDTIRGVLIVLVVAIHVASFMIWFNPKPNIASYFWFFAFGKFSVPGFVLLSGIVLMYSYRAKELSYVKFIKSRVLYIVVPYLIWSGVYFIYKTPVNVFDALVLLIKGKAMFHLYFIVIIFQFYLLFPLFKSITIRLSFKYVAVVGLIVQLVIFDIFSSVSFLRLFNPTIFLLWSYVFIIGMYVGKEYEKVMAFIDKNSGLILSLFVIATMFTYIKFNSQIQKGQEVWQSSDSMPILMTISSIFLLMYISRNFKLVKTVFNVLGKYSYQIYLMHMIPLLIFKVIFKEFDFKVTDVVAILLLLSTILISLGFSVLIKKMPGHKLMMGK